MTPTPLSAKLREDDERVETADVRALYRCGVKRRRRKRALLGAAAAAPIGLALIAGVLVARAGSDRSEDSETATTVDAPSTGFEVTGVEAPEGSFVECVALTVAGSQREEACIPRFQPFLWHVGGTDYLLSAGPLPLRVGDAIEPGATGFAIVPYAEISTDFADPVMCITPEAVEGMALDLGDRTATYSIPNCGANAAIVVEVMADGEAAASAYVLAGDAASGPMIVTSEFDTTVADRTERCSPVADVTPPGATLSLRDLCLSLG